MNVSVSEWILLLLEFILKHFDANMWIKVWSDQLQNVYNEALYYDLSILIIIVFLTSIILTFSYK